MDRAIRVRRHSAPSTAVVLALLAAACSSSKTSSVPSPTATGVGSAVNAEVASVDVYAGVPQRFQVGLILNDGRFVSYGSVGFRFSYTGPAQSPTPPQPGPEVTAAYLPTPGTPDGAGKSPTFTQPSEARGVYEATGVTFGHPGVWQVEVSADVQGAGTQTASASFEVASQPALPAPGRPALRTDNLTISSKGVPKGAIDSRATVSGGMIPDPELHRWTIAEAIAEHRPVVVVFSTPVFCTSRFCGPVTDLIEQMSKRYSNRAVFIHVEIWRDFQKNVVNKAAADWLYRNNELTEPWVYLIGANGVIQDRWNTLVRPSELETELRKLSLMK